VFMTRVFGTPRDCERVACVAPTELELLYGLGATNMSRLRRWGAALE